MTFATTYSDILALIDAIDPVTYGKTRNYLSGAVTRLSPYISRGVISTKQIAATVAKKGLPPHQTETLLKELAWRDYFQQVWRAKGNAIHQDLKQPQPQHFYKGVPTAVTQHQTRIAAIDQNIRALYAEGYMHNHMRMYVAMLCCNVARCHWLQPAKWMYYHLLDADWASNALSWQWVAGSFSNKKYFANQENINRFTGITQTDSFLDVPYENIETVPIPEVLRATESFELKTTLPATDFPKIDAALPLCIYNFYNLDCGWMSNVSANRVLLLEPDFFETYPVSHRTLQFVLQLSNNIPGIQIFAGSFEQLTVGMNAPQVHYKEHPCNAHYTGTQHPRDWMFENVTGYYPSFFSYWKAAGRNAER